MYLFIIRIRDIRISPIISGWITVHQLPNAVIRDAWRERVTDRLAFFKQLQEIIHSRLACTDLLGNLPS